MPPPQVTDKRIACGDGGWKAFLGVEGGGASDCRGHSHASAVACPQRCAERWEGRQTKPHVDHYARSHQPQTIPTLKKHCFSLSKVILMGTDVFMIINKISKGEFYGHMETLKSDSLPQKIVYVKDDEGKFKLKQSSGKWGCKRQTLQNQRQI